MFVWVVVMCVFLVWFSILGMMRVVSMLMMMSIISSLINVKLWVMEE